MRLWSLPTAVVNEVNMNERSDVNIGCHLGGIDHGDTSATVTIAIL